MLSFFTVATVTITTRPIILLLLLLPLLPYYFATNVDLPKEKWFKYDPPIKEEIKEPVIAKDETIIYNVDPVDPTTYIEKPPFRVRMKENAKVSTVVNKSYIRTPKPTKQIKVEPSVAMVRISWLKI